MEFLSSPPYLTTPTIRTNNPALVKLRHNGMDSFFVCFFFVQITQSKSKMHFNNIYNIDTCDVQIQSTAGLNL